MSDIKRLGRYIIKAHLGSGAYADVYRAQDEALKRLVALKVLKPALIADEDAFGRFMQEAQVAAQLFHPQIATVLDVGQAEGYYFIAMRYVDGPSLDQRLAETGPLPWSQARTIFTQIGQALGFAHGHGLVHRDIKPQNILVSPSEGAILTDFGLVRAMEASHLTTRTGALLGTPPYIAPEIWQGQPATAAADQYALACVLFEMLTGKALFTGPSPWAIMQQHSSPPHLPAQWPAGCPVGLSDILQRALAQQPEARYPGIAALLAAIDAAPDAEAHQLERQNAEKRRLVEAAEQARREAARPAEVRPPQMAEAGQAHPAVDPQPAAPTPAVPQQLETPPAAPRQPDGSAASTAGPRRSKTGPASRIQRRLPTWAGIVLGLGGVGIFIWVMSLTGWFGPPPPQIAVPGGSQPPPCTETGQEWTSPVDGMTLVCVPGGEFLMGSTNADGDADDDEKPQHTVYLDGYWMDQMEVTNAQYARCVADGVCREPGSKGSYMRDSYYGNSQYADYPVINVSWDDAVDYCRWAGRELPSEAQWEKAARGTDGRKYPWGSQPPNASLLNYNMNIGDTTAVGSYPDGASPYGALDMAGNVWEWTADWYDANYYSSQTTWRNPVGPSNGDARVLRGGSWYVNSRDVRAANRDGCSPDLRLNNLGFRCLLSP